MNTFFEPDPTEKRKGELKEAKLSSFDLDDILFYYKQAVAMVKEETGDEFTNFTFGNYFMEVDTTTTSIIHSFKLRASLAKSENTFYGKRVTGSNLFEFSFSSDANKKLTCTAGLDTFK